MAVPAYLTEYETTGKPICPECGHDFTGEREANVLAHSASHWESIDASEHYDEARRRRAILKKIAKELGE